MSDAVFLLVVLSLLNKPYKWGGDDPLAGYDCSGLIQDCYSILGIDPPGDQRAIDYYGWFSNPERGEILPLNLEEYDIGTLFFYGSDLNHIIHVAMGIGDTSVIEAGGGGSGTLTFQDAVLGNAVTRVRPYNRRKDLIAAVRPKGLPW